MSKVMCDAISCGYNEMRFCAKKKIDIEGLFAKNSIGTFCESFKNPSQTHVYDEEMAKEMCEPCHTSIMCSANYCRYNDDNYCKKDDIKIGTEKAIYKSETECESFKLR